MLKTGVLDSVKRIYGVHIFNGIPSGKISLEAGPRMAATNWLAVHLYGRSGHAGKPHEGIDTAVAVSSMVMNFQSIISRNLNPLDPAVLTIGKVEAGTARNVIAGEAKIEGTARTFSRQAQEMIERRVKEIAKAHEQMYGVDVSVDFQQSSHGALINDPGVVEGVMEKAGEVFDPSEFTHVEAMMLGEDLQIIWKKWMDVLHLSVAATTLQTIMESLILMKSIDQWCPSHADICNCIRYSS